MAGRWEELIKDWSEAGLIDDAVAARIRAFEEHRQGTVRWRWPMWLAAGLGGLMLAGGILLFVAAHWDTLSPSARFAIVVASVGLLHVGGASTSGRWPATGSALHAAGTVALGGGVFLAGQIFNMAEHWPGGFMLWTLGAAVAFALVRDWPQLVILAAVAPIWLGSEWVVAVGNHWDIGSRIAAGGAFLTALTYFTNTDDQVGSVHQRALVGLGAFALVLSGPALAVASSQLFPAAAAGSPAVSLLVTGWTIAIGGPLLLGLVLRGRQAWTNAVAAAWTVALLHLHGVVETATWLYAWWALGAVALVAWGVKAVRTERINMGVAMFAATLLAFYFSEVMTKLGRSASLVGLGLLFLAGGWALERGRRRLVRESKGGQS